MKRFFILSLAVLIMILTLSACAAVESDSTEILTEPTIVMTEPIPTLPPATEPPVTQSPTDPPEPTIPPLGEAAGSTLECYYSDEYEDYLNYYIHIPENAVVGMPLIVYLHGDGEVNDPEGLPERGIRKFAKGIYGEAFPFILLEPNTRIKSWTRGDIPKLLFELINHIAERYSVNTDKIILTGHSRGAIGVWDMISIYGGYFSAAVPVSSPHQKDHIDYIKAAEVPVWTFAGNIGETERWYHQYLAQNVDIINGCDGYGKFTILYGCDHGQAKYEAYVKETFDWMLEQQRGVIPEE
ncbi:MAG: hypothetical protein IKT52_06805 [Oscillospiraceae bacterium]|nr:hypothetical protein [Oscillospiraceae bacterium]